MSVERSEYDLSACCYGRIKLDCRVIIKRHHALEVWINRIRLIVNLHLELSLPQLSKSQTIVNSRITGQ